MCLEKDYIDKIDTIFNEIKSHKERLNKDLSKVDLEIEDFLHFIEFENFNACQGYKYAKRIQELRKTRRNIKNELDPIANLYNSMSVHIQPAIKKVSKNIEKNNKPKIYVPRIVKSI